MHARLVATVSRGGREHRKRVDPACAQRWQSVRQFSRATEKRRRIFITVAKLRKLGEIQDSLDALAGVRETDAQLSLFRPFVQMRFERATVGIILRNEFAGGLSEG